MRNSKKRMLQSLLSLVLCFSMLMGSTFAWFTDSVTNTGNVIQSGNLDLKMYWTDDLDDDWHDIEDAAYNTVFSCENWEPGRTDVKYIKLVNEGNLALNYQLTLAPQNEVGKLAEVINVHFANEAVALNEREDLSKLGVLGLLNNVMNGGAATSGTILPEGQSSPLHPTEEVILTIALEMVTTAGNEYQNESSGDFTIKALATQAAYEQDAFGSNYDSNATYKDDGYNADFQGGKSTASVTPVDGKVPTGGVELNGGTISAYVPEGVALEDGAEELTLKVTPLEESATNISVVNNEILIPVDVHIDGVAADNTVPIIVDLQEVLPKYLNMGNYHLYHVENGTNAEMTLVDSREDLVAHNQFTYDPNTGNVSVAMCTFSEVALIADTTKAWEGNYDYDWYDASKTELTIANADQLAAFGAIVGGMAEGIEKDSFAKKTVKLLSDINLGDKESENNPGLIFYPIGYYNSNDNYKKVSGGSVTSSVSSFEGTFDGNGHTIANFYQNTWEMFGDYNVGYSGTPNHYKDAMGLFGYVLNGTVKNLTVSNFSSDGEFTPTGVIAAYADGNTTFENIAITNCNPRVYNTGNGGIIGIAGDTSAANDDHIELKNITVDNSNKISALWGSYDVACGGLVGMYRGNVDGSGNATGDTISFENCHVSAIMDVYNDVCANYQYYAYRYAGMIIGSVRHNTTNNDGKTVPNMTGISASGCTVNYGDWNDYYYCEFEKNSMASYSEDYQFSRVPHSELNFTDSNGNGVVDIDERASVTGCKHNHTAEENHQAIYLPFHQLFTGYSWGVSSIGLKEYSGIVTDLGIEEGEQEESVEKFKSLEIKSVYNEKEIKASELFEAIVDCKVKINDSTFHMGITNLDENGNVTAEFILDKDNWEDSIIILKNTGKISITVQDYYFCTPTTIEVDVVARPQQIKFASKFTGDFLYRVGNKNTVSVGSLFEAIELKNQAEEPLFDEEGNVKRAQINNEGVEVIIESLDGNTTSASGKFTSNATDWTKGTIKFEGTGVVKVIIQDNNFCIPTELLLEVVDATNHSSATISSLGGNTVLLTNTKLNKNGALALQNASLYGNGFELDVTEGRFTGESITANYLVYLNNGVLDNVQIKGAVYKEYGAQASNDYNNPVVLSVGNNVIANSYISNCSSPVRVRSGNLEIINSTLKGGNFANLDIRGGVVVLNNVTTINQLDLNDKASDGTEIVGLGIVVYYEGPTADTKIVIEGDLVQHNNVAESIKLQNEYAETFRKEMFDEKYSDYHYADSNKEKWVNTGIISMSADVGEGNIVNSAQNNASVYSGKDVSFYILGLGNNEGYVYTTTPKTLENEYVEWLPNMQHNIVPKIYFDHTVNEYPKQENSEKSCTYDSATDIESITFLEGESFEWDVNILKSSNKEITYEVFMNGNKNSDKIVFDKSGTYEIVYKYIDENNYRINEDGEAVKFSVEYETSMTVIVSAVKPTAQNAEITFPLLESYGTTKVTVDGKTYIMPNLTGTNVPKYGDNLDFDASNRKYGSLKADGKASVDIYYPIIKTDLSGNYMVFPVFGNKNGTLVQIQDYADNGVGVALTPYNASTKELPTGLSVSRGYTVQWSTDKEVVGSGKMSYGSWTSGLLAFKYQSSSDDIACKVMSNYLSYYPNINLRSNDRNEQVMVAEYKYVDNKGDTFYYCVGYHIEERNSGYAFGKTVPESSGGGCVTPDSLITLADGSKVRVDSLTGSEQLLVWNMETGSFDSAPIMFVDSDPEAVQDVIMLYFSDNTEVSVIYEHGFWDYDLNKYVYLDKNAADYIGHTFAKQDGDKLVKVKLTDVDIQKERTTAWSPVTVDHLCYFVNGMLSMPGGVGGLFNIFDVVPETMTYDYDAMARDIQTYGLFTYEELSQYAELPEAMFDAAGGKYLKVSIGKGNMTMDELIAMINRYNKFF